MYKEDITLTTKDPKFFIPTVGEWYHVAESQVGLTGKYVKVNSVRIFKTEPLTQLLVEAKVEDEYGTKYDAPTGTVQSFYQKQQEEEKGKKKLKITTYIEEV